jgi:hypothetical protein
MISTEMMKIEMKTHQLTESRASLVGVTSMISGTLDIITLECGVCSFLRRISFGKPRISFTRPPQSRDT